MYHIFVRYLCVMEENYSFLLFNADNFEQLLKLLQPRFRIQLGHIIL